MERPFRSSLPSYPMTSDTKRKVQPVAAGCVVRASDIPIVIISFTCFAAFIIYGGSNASLGASVPALSRALGKSESSIGFIFIFRGAGFLTGTLGSAALMTRPSLPLSKEFITCLASVVMGISTFFMSCTTSYQLVLGLSVLQGLGFGGIDCISNCLLPELWGTRIQPWMQALHLCFGIGAMIGPSLVGYFGYVTTYRVLGISAFAPLVALEIYKFYTTAANIAAPASSITNGSDNAEDITKDDVASFYKYASTSITEDDEDGADMDSTYAPFSLREGHGHGKHHVSPPGTDLQTLRNSVSNSSVSSADTMETAENDSGKSSQCEDTDTEDTYSHPVTFTLRMVILAFYFIYTGIEAGYAGWIPVYVLEEGITTTDSQAAYVSATFWAAMTIGRMLAVFTAMAFSATFMLRFHLVFSAACAVMFMFVEQVGTLQYALMVSALMGLAESAIYALVMTIVSDYGYTMDAQSTTLFMVGATIGEAGMPMAIGFLLEGFGPRSLPWTVLVCCGLLVVLYGVMHVLAAQGAHDHEHLLNGEGGGETYNKISAEGSEHGGREEGDVEMPEL